MNLDYISFNIEDAIQTFKNGNEYTIDNIIKFHIIDLCSKTNKFEDDTLFIQNYEFIRCLPATVATFTSKINDTNFIKFYYDTDLELKEGFWNMINKYKVYNKISAETFSTFLCEKINPYDLFQYKNIVYHFDEQCLIFIKTNYFMIEMLLSYAFEEHNTNLNIYFPKSLDPKIKVTLAEKYINYSKVNPNYLKLIINAKATEEFPIPDELRLLARRKYHEWWDINGTSTPSFGYGISVSFVSRPDESSDIHREGRMINYEFSKEWIANNPDYATLLNNFIYLFGYCDSNFRSTFVSHKNDASTLENVIVTRNVTDYFISDAFRRKSMLYSAEMAVYYKELKSDGIDMENIFKWFFERYLPSEFNVSGFYYLKNTKKTSFLAKCILLSCTIDSILKQFNMYCLNKCIDRELIEISSKPLGFSKVISLINYKYVYSSSDEINRECNLLFSDQSLITYLEKVKTKYTDLPSMLESESITLDDYAEFQKVYIQWLISRETLFSDENGALHTNNNKVRILKKLFYKDVICYSYEKNIIGIIDDLIEKSDLKSESTLFSEPEQRYLDYMLNNSRFGNGPALRNKYVHGTYSLDAKINEKDYYELLKIMVLIIIKINEELCLLS